MSSDIDSVLPVTLRACLSKRAERGQLELPVLPETAARVLTMSQSATCDVQEIADLIERDPSLAAHVLQLSNSVAFAPREQIVSLHQAVARLGLSTLCEVTVAIVLKSSVFEVAGFEATLSRLWRHSAATGIFAKEIARTLRRNVEGAFLCGLLHDIGKPVTLAALVGICEEADVELDIEMAEAAMAHYHTLVGGMLIRDWGLPGWVESAASNHHEYRDAEGYRLEAMVTCLADKLARWAMNDGISEDDLFNLRVIEDLEMYEDDMTSLLACRDKALGVAEALT